MEIHPGVFVSRLGADDWETDPEVGGQMHVLVQAADSYVGMTRYDADPGPIAWTLPVRESFLVLDGTARIEVDGGAVLELGVGDMASLPEGARTIWHVTVPYRELWFFPRSYETSPG